MKCVSPLSGVLLVWLCLGLPAGLRCSLEEQVSSGMLEMVSTGQGWLNHTAVRSLFNQLERRVQWAAVSCEKVTSLPVFLSAFREVEVQSTPGIVAPSATVCAGFLN